MLALLLGSACGKDTEEARADRARSAVATPTPPASRVPVAPPTTAPATPTAGVDDQLAAEAKAVFAARCVACHGESGHGDGPAAAALTPRPRDYTDARWQQETTDEEIETAIAEGGPAVGKSVNMPPNPDLARRPELIAALRAYIRSFGSK